MKLTWLSRRGGPPGFRLSAVDLGVLGLLSLIAWGIHGATPHLTLYLVPLYVGATFFLFCNVFRIGNRLERVWYVPFVLATGYAVHVMDMALLWLLVGWVFEPLKWVLIAFRVISGPYAGICHGPVNRWRRR